MKSFCFFLLLALCWPANAQSAGSEAPAAPFSQSRFVPDLSLILDLAWSRSSLDDRTAAFLFVPGFAGAVAEDGRLYAGAGGGFALHYAEMVVGATVDPYFDLQSTFHLGQEGFEIEEAWVRSRGLPAGWQITVGKMLSAFGRQNARHAHAWNFPAAPLPLRLFFGAEGLNEVGVRLTWMPRLPFQLLIGGEVSAGENEASFGRAVGDDGGRNADKPLGVGFVKAAVDSQRLLAAAGFSIAHGRARRKPGEDTGVDPGFIGNATVFGVDVGLKYYLDSYRFIGLQAEYLQRVQDGRLPAAGQAYRAEQGGGYLEWQWRLHRRWSVQVRWEAVLDNDRRCAGLHQPDYGGMYLWRAAWDWLPSEFTRVRLHYTYDHSSFSADGRRPFHAVGLDINVAVGAHGAHAW